MRKVPIAAARRIALGAQGFATPRPAGRIDARHLRRVLRHVGQFQLDSVNVVVRAHYLPAFSRLGPYPMELLDDLAYRRREMFEYWGHAAALLPIENWPLFRFRMDAIRPWRRLRKVMDEHPGFVDRVLEEVARRGPLTVGELEDGGERSGPWWGHSRGKTALEWHFDKGRVSIADRRNFTRSYDVAERVIPQRWRAAPAPDQPAAYRELLLRGAAHLGIGTATDIADYYRLRLPLARPLIAELSAAGRLEEVEVPGWGEPAYLHPQATRPRRIEGRALLTPFDPVVWERPRVERLFGFRYRIEIYVPEAERRYGYYVMPFLLDDALVARVDLKSDRAAGLLLVKGAFAEDGHERARVARELAAELRDLASWLGLGDVAVSDNGDLAAPLAGELR